MVMKMKRRSISVRALSLFFALLLALSASAFLFTGCTQEETGHILDDAASALVDGLLDVLDTATTQQTPQNTDTEGQGSEQPPISADTEKTSVEQINKTMYLADTVRARRSASKNADYDGKLERGTEVKVLTRDTESNWCSFLYDGKTYYVNWQSLTDKKPGTSAESGQNTDGAKETEDAGEKAPDEHAYYYTKDDVALYLHVYGHLPDNFITKKEAEALGWDSSKGNLWKVADGFCIGGDRFGNYEGILPKNNGTYYECDVGYAGGFRGADRLIYDNKGDIWYTGDHYASFTKLY